MYVDSDPESGKHRNCLLVTSMSLRQYQDLDSHLFVFAIIRIDCRLNKVIEALMTKLLKFLKNYRFAQYTSWEFIAQSDNSIANQSQVQIKEQQRCNDCSVLQEIARF